MLAKKRADKISGAVFLIGLGVLFFTGFWWPGILMLIGVTSLAQGLAQGRGWSGLQGAVWMIGLGILALTNLWWPGILILIGVSILIGYFQHPQQTNGWEKWKGHGYEEDTGEDVHEADFEAVNANTLNISPPPPDRYAGQEEHILEEIEDEDYANERLEKALIYRQGMDQLIRQQVGPKRVTLQKAADEMDKGIEAIRNLVRRVDNIANNPVLQSDLKTTPAAIEQMEARLESEHDPSIRAELERALKSRQTQLQNLQHLDRVVKRADIQIDNMLAAIGTVYAQMQLIDAKHIDSSKAQQLFDDVSEQVKKTQDLIYSVEEVYRSSAT